MPQTLSDSARLGRRRFLTLGGVVAAGVRLAAQAPPAVVPSALIRTRRLSWAGVSLELPDRSVFIDPWVTPAIWGGTWTDGIVPLAPASSARTVLLTHLHNDHFDPEAIRAVATGGSVTVVCLRPQAATVAALGIRTWGVDLYEPVVVGRHAVAIAVPAVDGVAAHDGQVSWVIRAGGRTIIHCGDTMHHGHFPLISRAYGPFDVAFLPINGAQVLAMQPRTGQPMSMTPPQAVGAAESLGARVVVPIHYGHHDPSAYLEYPNALPTLLETARTRAIAVSVVTPGAAGPTLEL